MNIRKLNRSKRKIVLILTKKNGDIKKYKIKKNTHFFRIVSSENFKKAYLKVRYGKKVNCFMKKVEFYNDGNYSNKEDLIYAFNAFISET